MPPWHALLWHALFGMRQTSLGDKKKHLHLNGVVFLRDLFHLDVIECQKKKRKCSKEKKRKNQL